MRKSVFLIIALIIQDTSIKAADEVIDAKGDMYFNASCYSKARAEYYKAYQKRPNDAKLLKRITEVILLDEEVRDTATYFIDKYLEIESDDKEAYYMAAQSHFYARNFSKASKLLSNYQTLITAQSDIDKAEKLQQFIKNSQRMMKDTLRCKLVNLGSMINTANSELNAFIYGDDQTLIFSSDDKYNSTEMINYFNVKFSETSGLLWSKSKTVTGDVNTLYDEYVVGISKDIVLFNSNRDVQFSIYESKYRNAGRLSEGIKYKEPIDMKGDEVGATLTPSGDTIIFSATTSNGKLDLFYSIKKINGKWGAPRPLPGNINIDNSDENYPNITPDGRRLYFASDREGSMGGYDIFYSDYNEKTREWGSPVQMKYPINDMYDNMTISHTSNGRYAYISSIRKGGFGSRDIYAVIFDEYELTPAIMKCYVGIKAKPKPLPVNEMPRVEVYDEKGELVANVKTNLTKQTFILALDPGVYTLNIEVDGAKDYKEIIDVAEKVYTQDAIEKIIILEPSDN